MRWVQVVTELSRAFTLCAASGEVTEIREERVSSLQVPKALGLALSADGLAGAEVGEEVSDLLVVERAQQAGRHQ